MGRGHDLGPPAPDRRHRLAARRHQHVAGQQQIGPARLDAARNVVATLRRAWVGYPDDVGLARLLDDEPLRRKVAAGGAALMAGRSWEDHDEVAEAAEHPHLRRSSTRRG